MSKETIKAKADGRNGQIDFDIDLDGNHIHDVKVTKSADTPAIFNQVFDKLKNSVIDNQSFDVDAVSGASLMTQAMLDSGKKALEDKDMGALPYRAAKTGTKLVQDFKEACGGRMKKKREEGGLIDWDKCGKKMKKKCENGGLID